MSVAADHQHSLNGRFSRLPMLPSPIYRILTMGSFSLASVIRNVAVVGLPKGGKNRSDSAPEWPQVAFSAAGHGYPHGPSTRAQCNAVCAISRYNRLSEPTFGFRSAKNAPRDCFRSTKRKKMKILDRKSSE